jgi:hypothetical protein
MYKARDDLFDAGCGFSCNNVTYQAKPEWIRKFATGDLADQKSVFICMKSRGKVLTRNYTPRRVRYENPDTECDNCKKKIGINEEGHILQHCSAWCSDMHCSKTTEYVFAKMRLLRAMTRSERELGL